MIYTREMYEEGIDKIAKMLLGKEPAYIGGIVRGGYQPAVDLSYLLNVPFMAINWTPRPRPEAKDQYGILNKKDIDFLIVDDLIDTGGTVASVHKYFGREFKWACLVYNVRQPYRPIAHHLTIDRDVTKEAVEFYWENDTWLK